MKTISKTIALASVVLACTAACTVTTDPGPVQTYNPTVPSTTQGNLRVDWTIDGSTDPNRCNQSGVSGIEISVTTAGGANAGSYQQQCQTFATSIALDPGDYSAFAVLIDGAGQPRTTAVPIAPFTIRGNDELRIPIDFPASSFF